MPSGHEATPAEAGAPEGSVAAPRRPRVTLAWAQSLDGSIAARRDDRLKLSGPESSRLTHELRAAHEAILVGIGTVLADDPRLDVRLVEGPSPLPIVLDPSLRTPADCRLLRPGARRPRIFCAAGAPGGRRKALEAAGARVEALPEAPSGGLDLAALLDRLGEEGVASLMVEGGGRILRAFLEARLVDRIVVTVAPLLVGGYAPFAESAAAGTQAEAAAAVGPAATPPSRARLPLPALRSPRWRILGEDVVLEAEPA